MGGRDATPLAGDWSRNQARCRPVPLGRVRLGGFLGRRVDANVDSLLAGLESPIPRRFEALARGEEPGSETMRLAADSDLYKWVEGASCALAYSGDARLEEALGRIVPFILARQAPDGYINTQVPPYERLDTRVNHDLYQAGHLFEAAVAHFKATGQRDLLDAARRWAGWIHAQHRAGHPYLQQAGEREHPEIELGLVRLYHATGQAAHLDLARALAGLNHVAPRVGELHCGGGQRHAVRVGYLLAALAELYLEGGGDEGLATLCALWDELVRTRLYVTGGLGYNERIPEFPHDLPETVAIVADRDIAETCASVAMMMLSWRMHAITGECRYYDLIETILYNHYLGALSPDGLATFYYNPLRLVGDQAGRSDHGGRRDRRTRLPEVHSTACCMPNAWRFFGALPEYVFSLDEEGVRVDLYTSASAHLHAPDGTPLTLQVDTDYPHDGRVDLALELERPAGFTLRLRVPGWCHGAMLRLPDGEEQPVTGGRYVVVRRRWQPGDHLRLALDVPVRALTPAPEVAASAGRVALARGPLVYCLEGYDSPVAVERVALVVAPGDAPEAVSVKWEADLLGGVNVLECDARALPAGPAEGLPYGELALRMPSIRVRLVPFYARANRGEGARWVVWLPRASG